MGFLDELKDKAGEFGDEAKEGLGAAKDKTEEVIENVKDRFDGDDDTPTLSDESAGYSGAGAEDIRRPSQLERTPPGHLEERAAAQDNAEGIGEPLWKERSMLHRRSTRPSRPGCRRPSGRSM